ncbi:hypothetical protein ACOSQ4_015847 [Xanthoceras sorbifolium]
MIQFIILGHENNFLESFPIVLSLERTRMKIVCVLVGVVCWLVVSFLLFSDLMDTKDITRLREFLTITSNDRSITKLDGIVKDVGTCKVSLYLIGKLLTSKQVNWKEFLTFFRGYGVLLKMWRLRLFGIIFIFFFSRTN